MNHLIRLATGADSEAILKIYSFYIINTAYSFETEVPSVNEFKKRIEGIIKAYPYLVYLINGEIVGYAYASRYAERAAYLYDVSVSVYITSEYHGCGIAYKLYERLFKILNWQGYYNAYAGITVPNDRSKNFHKKFGFTEVGTYHKIGYKFEKWHDLTYMEKAIKNHSVSPVGLKTLSDLPEVIIAGI